MGISCDARPRGRARRLRALGASAVGVAVVAALAGPAAGAPAAATTQSFTTPGTYTFTVPAGVSSISATAVAVQAARPPSSLPEIRGRRSAGPSR